jgi:hypothetical protein
VQHLGLELAHVGVMPKMLDQMIPMRRRGGGPEIERAPVVRTLISMDLSPSRSSVPKAQDVNRHCGPRRAVETDANYGRVSKPLCYQSAAVGWFDCGLP